MRLRRQAVSASSWTSWVSVGVAGWYSSRNGGDVALVGGEVFGGEDGGAAGEAVAEGVERRALFTGGGAGAGGGRAFARFARVRESGLGAGGLGLGLDWVRHERTSDAVIACGRGGGRPILQRLLEGTGIGWGEAGDWGAPKFCDRLVLRWLSAQRQRANLERRPPLGTGFEACAWSPPALNTAG